MKTAVIYARYSSDRQTEQSIEGQVRVCNDYAERNDILIVNQYIVPKAFCLSRSSKGITIKMDII